MTEQLHESIANGYESLFEDVSGTSSALYSDGVGQVPESEYFASVGVPLAQKWMGPSVVTTEMDDSDQWNGSEMDDFDGDDSDLIEELKINDLTHVTTPIDNNDPLVDIFHSTGSYKHITNTIKGIADGDAFDLKHIADKKSGVYHLATNANLMKHPENWNR